MKWKNPGHEFDAVYDNIGQKKSFFLFGGGDYGHQFFPVMHNEIEISGYIDNDPHKIGTIINGLPCLSLAEIMISPDLGIVLTMSQIARISAI